MEGLEGPVEGATLLWGGDVVVAWEPYGTFRAWELDSGAPMDIGKTRALQSICSVDVFPDRRLVISTYGRVLELWDVASGGTLARFAADATLNCCAVTEDGRTVITGDESGRVSFFRLESLTKQSRLSPGLHPLPAPGGEGNPGRR